MSIASIIDEIMVSTPGFVTSRPFEMLVRRFNAVQVADDSGEWSVADTFDIGRTSKFFISPAEMELVMSHANRADKLRSAFAPKKSKRRGRGRGQNRSSDDLRYYGANNQQKQQNPQQQQQRSGGGRGGGQQSGGPKGRGGGSSGSGSASSN